MSSKENKGGASIGEGLDAKTLEKLAKIGRKNGPMFQHLVDPTSVGYDPDYKDELDEANARIEELAKKSKE